MKSVLLSSFHNLEIREKTIPVIRYPDYVLLKVKSVGICGSDIHYYTQGKIGDQIISYPFCIGHEFSGIIESVGSDVKDLNPGDRVVVDPLVSCGKCTQCLQGRFHTCLNQKFIGCPGQLEGALTEYIVLPSKCCFRISDSLTLQESVLAEPISIALHALSFIDDKVESIAIFGVGPIGLSVLVSAGIRGIKKIYTTDLQDYRNEVAFSNGACYSGNPAKTDIVEEILEIEQEGVDAVFDCCGRQEAIDQAINILKPGGKLFLVGIPEVDSISYNPHLMRRKELQIQNVRRQNEQMQNAIDTLLRYKEKFQFLITHDFQLDDVSKAFNTVEKYEDGVLKAIVNI